MAGFGIADQATCRVTPFEDALHIQTAPPSAATQPPAPPDALPSTSLPPVETPPVTAAPAPEVSSPASRPAPVTDPVMSTSPAVSPATVPHAPAPTAGAPPPSPHAPALSPEGTPLGGEDASDMETQAPPATQAAVPQQLEDLAHQFVALADAYRTQLQTIEQAYATALHQATQAHGRHRHRQLWHAYTRARRAQDAAYRQVREQWESLVARYAQLAQQHAQ